MIDAVSRQSVLYSRALMLAVLTIVYNLVEGSISTYAGFDDESIALFGFGVDSFIEVISGLGIAFMIMRLRSDVSSSRDDKERTALRITGWAFYVLVAGLLVSGVHNVYTSHVPETTLWGVVISGTSIGIMWLLIREKISVGTLLESAAILADAECTRVCIYMSVVLLASSLLYELTGFIYADSIGAFGLSYFAWKEGRECFHKAESNALCGCEHDTCNS